MSFEPNDTMTPRGDAWDTERAGRNHPSHRFGSADPDCLRCLSCEVLYGGLHSGEPCPAETDHDALMSEADADVRLDNGMEDPL